MGLVLSYPNTEVRELVFRPNEEPSQRTQTRSRDSREQKMSNKKLADRFKVKMEW